MPAPALQIEYRLTAPGWAVVVVRTPGRAAELTASYLTDALGDLAAAAAAVLAGQRQAFVRWEAEPGEHLWLVERHADAAAPLDPAADRVTVRLLSDAAVVRWFAGAGPDAEALRASMEAAWTEAGIAFAREGDALVVDEAPDGLVEIAAVTLPLAGFAAAVRRTLEAVLHNHGQLGYLERWAEEDHPFPLAALEALRRGATGTGGAGLDAAGA